MQSRFVATAFDFPRRETTLVDFACEPEHVTKFFRHGEVMISASRSAPDKLGSWLEETSEETEG